MTDRRKPSGCMIGSLLLSVASLALTEIATAQGMPEPRGIPFRIDPAKVSPDRSGWHLNLANNLRQDFGEFSRDFGGSSNDGVFPLEQAPRWTATHPHPSEAHYVDGGAQIYQIENKVLVAEGEPAQSGLRIRMITPLRQDGSTPSEVQFLGLDLLGTVWIDDPGTRPYTPHTRTLLDWDTASVTMANIPVVAKLGGTVIYIDDHNGGTPMVAAIQNAMVVARWLRDNFEDIAIYHTGGSFGGNVGVICSILAPDLFDGVQSSGASLCAPFWKHLQDFNELRLLAENQPALIHRDTATWDDAFTILGQHGLRRHHFDILRFPELFRTPLFLINGRDDGLALPHNLENQIQNLAAGILGPSERPYIGSMVLEEGGHGLPEAVLTDPEVAKFWLLSGFQNSLQQPRASSPYVPRIDADNDNDFWQRYATYDDTLRARHKTFHETVDPYLVYGVIPLGSIGAYEFGRTTPPEVPLTRPGLGTQLGRQRQTAQIHDGCLITSNLEGYVSKYRLQSGQLIEEWSRFTGFNIQSLHATYLDGTPVIIVGDYRGLHYLRADDPDGHEFHHDPEFDRFRCINSADLSEWGFDNGPHVLYVADGELLVIEDKNQNVVFKEPIGVTGRLRIREEDHGLGTRSYIYASLARGHIARFRFDLIDEEPALVADMISSYLEFQPTDFDFTTVSVPVGQGATIKVDLMVVGGRQYDMDRNEDGHGPEDRTCWLAVLGMNGLIYADYPLVRRNPRADGDPTTDDEIIDEPEINRIESLGGSKVLVSTPGWISHIDLANWQAFSPQLRGAGWFVTGKLDGGSASAETKDLAVFGATGIQVLSVNSSAISQQPVAQLHTRIPTTATDLSYHNDRWELSVLDGDWILRTYDATNGRMLRGFQWPRWEGGQHPPRVMIRTDPDLLDHRGFEIFDDAGIIVEQPRLPPRRAAYKAGRIVFADSKEEEHEYLLQHDEDYVVSAEIDASGNAEPQTGYSGWGGAAETPVMGPVTRATREVALHQLRFPDGPWPILFGNQSGNLYWFHGVQDNAFSMGPWSPTRMDLTGQTSRPSTSFPAGNKKPGLASGRVLFRGEEPMRLGCQDISVIDSADANHDDVMEVVVGAEMANHDGHTLFMLQWLRSGGGWLQHSRDAGSVTGAALLDVDGNQDLEVVVGTQTGTVRIYDLTLSRLLREFDTGGLNAGARGSIWVIPGEDAPFGDPMLLVGHSLGVSSYAITDTVD